MRLFVAVTLDSVVAGRLADFSAEVRRRVRALAPEARVTWVTPERLHVTLRFIGEVDAPQAQAVSDALATPLTTDRFDLTVAGAGAFPRTGAPRVLWVGVMAGGPLLERLESEVGARLVRCGLQPDGRPFQPHVTLARVREPSGLRTAPLFDGLADRKFGTSQVDAITLFQSRTSPQGSIYTPLRRTPLAS